MIRGFKEYYYQQLYSSILDFSECLEFSIDVVPDIINSPNPKSEVVLVAVEADLFNNIGLDINEKLKLKKGELPEKLYYAYQIYDKSVKGEDSTILRYDCSDHYPDLDNFPHHKHIGGKVESNYNQNLSSFFDEFQQLNKEGKIDEALEKIRNSS